MLLPGFCENSNTTLAQRSRFCYADPDSVIELRALTNEQGVTLFGLLFAQEACNE
jgi:hypothetical protein